MQAIPSGYYGVSERPIFILCSARSGSTLLRLMLDAHSEIACPPESNIAAAFGAIAFSAGAATGHDETQRDAVYAICRRVADDLLGAHARGCGKQRWADKSLISVEHAELLRSVYPHGRFICLYRQYADVAASLQEVCTWGYQAFGVEPYARQLSNNLVAALANYWVDWTGRMLEFERAHEDACLRVRYEDLVVDPAHQLQRIFKFVDVDAGADEIGNALQFDVGKADTALGDIKVRFTQGVHAESVGRGWTVPVEMLPTFLRERVDDLLEQLEYSLLHDLAGAAASGAEPSAGATSQEVDGRYDTDLVDSLPARIANRLASSAGGWAKSPPMSIKLILADAGAGPWVIDTGARTIDESDGPATWVAVTDTHTLGRLADGGYNAGAALRESTLRIATAAESSAESFLEPVKALVDLIRV